MQTAIDIFTLLVVIAAPFLTFYLVVHAVCSWWSRRKAPDPYAEFDRWGACFNEGIQARQCGLEPEDNPHTDDARDYDAWLDGYMAADGLRRLNKAFARAGEREVA